jgi:HK97 family phage portal protein
MAIFDRLRLKKRQGILPMPQPNAYVDSLGRVSRYYDTVYAGTFVDEGTTLSIPGLWRGITLISDTIGALPVHAYRGDVRIEPIPSILERPYPNETRIETISAMAASLVIHGNYIAILGDIGANGYPESIYPVSPTRVHIERIAGRLTYKIADEIYEAERIMHIKNFTLPGQIVGLGVVAAQRQGIGSALAMQAYAAKYFDGGAQPTGILYSDNADLTQDEADMLKAVWMRHYGGTSREPAVLNSTTKFQQLSDNAKDSQLVESREFSLTEIANMLGLPGYYLGAPNSSRTYSNVEQEQLQFLRGITPLLTRIEMAFTDLLPRGQYAKFNTDALLRSDTLTRYQAHKIALESGFLTVDEVRADFENRPPIGEPETTIEEAEEVAIELPQEEPLDE